MALIGVLWALLVFGAYWLRFDRLARLEDPVARANALLVCLFQEGFWMYLAALGPVCLVFLSALAEQGVPGPFNYSRYGYLIRVSDLVAAAWILIISLNQLNFSKFRKLVTVGQDPPHLKRLRSILTLWSYVVLCAALALYIDRARAWPFMLAEGLGVVTFFAGAIAINRLYTKWAARQPDLIVTPETHALFGELCATAGIKGKLAPSFSLQYGRGLWAFATTQSRVYVTPAFCRELTSEEQRFILAHELAHIKLGHVQQRMKAVGWLRVLAVELMVLPALFLESAPELALATLTLGPLIALLIVHRKMWLALPIFRQQEFEADAFAVRFSDPATAGEALSKVHASIGSDVLAETSVYTHPPLAQRIVHLQSAPPV